jgi:adenylate cyclase class 2
VSAAERDSLDTLTVDVMAIEVEQKFRCEDLDAVRRALVERGAAGGETVEQVDRYYRHPVRDFAVTDEAFRMRSVGSRNCLTYKGPKLDAQTKTRIEEEVAVEAGAEAAATCDRLLGRLGFSPVAVVRKRRQCWAMTIEGLRVEVALDEVDGVGPFVELEIQIAAGSDHEKHVMLPEVEAAESVLAGLALDLGLRNSERRSYLELLLERAD